ncbi:MAG TPA: hypothetical protein VMU84_03100 [Thermoanaerobaculia bacterium]|nr:hypothetical protein [Thermoanaerobaculia bacterium]
MAVSFKTDVLPLFQRQPPQSIKHMARLNVFLDKYEWMSDPKGNNDWPDHANANYVYARLAGNQHGSQMPPGGPFWTPAELKVLSDWMNVTPTYQP